jgi:phosphoglycerol transferase MdoB-like AlkP superfamily enzyme
MNSSKTSRPSNRLWPIASFLGVYLVLGALLRGVLWWKFGHEADIAAGELGWILPVGAFKDFIQGLYLLTPFILYVLLVPSRWYQGRANRIIMTVGSLLTLVGMLYLSCVEYFFFEEFSARFNLVAVDYLMYPTEVIGDIRDAYPVKTVLAATCVLALAIFLLLRKRLLPNGNENMRLGKRTGFALLHFALLGFGIGFVHAGSFTASNTNSTNRVANEIASNGAATFFRALRTSEIEYPAYYLTRSREQNLNRLTEYFASQGTPMRLTPDGRMERQFAAKPAGLGKLNVVVVAEESLGAEFSKLYGSHEDLTPNFDRIAQQGLWFKNMYASGTRTVRGLEAITASFPPIPSVSILRRPNNEGIATWGQIMSKQGYSTSFLYGGYGYFDNMNYFYEHNGYAVLDRNDIDHVRFANIWGVSDEDLFDRALTYFDERSNAKEPFFSIVMTTSNHKPFTFREGVPGVPAKGGGRAAGVRYADFALGYFLKEAEKHDWFKDTIFVVLGDHGARVYGKAEIPLKTYEIPLMIYAPAHLQPQAVTTLTSQIDVAPTVLGLLGFAYEAPFFGTDVLACSTCERMTLFSHNHDVAVYKEGELAVFGLNKELNTVQYNRAADSYTEVPQNEELTDLGVAIYQTAYELFRDQKYR